MTIFKIQVSLMAEIRLCGKRCSAALQAKAARVCSKTACPTWEDVLVNLLGSRRGVSG